MDLGLYSPVKEKSVSGSEGLEEKKRLTRMAEECRSLRGQGDWTRENGGHGERGARIRERRAGPGTVGPDNRRRLVVVWDLEGGTNGFDDLVVNRGRCLLGVVLEEVENAVEKLNDRFTLEHVAEYDGEHAAANLVL